MRNKFCGLIFRVFDWQENSWGINFHGNGGVVSTIIVGFSKYAIVCTTKSMKIIHLKNFYMYSNTRILQENTVFVDSLASSSTVIINSLPFLLGVGGY